jgi:hypothetical protein
MTSEEFLKEFALIEDRLRSTPSSNQAVPNEIKKIIFELSQLRNGLVNGPLRTTIEAPIIEKIQKVKSALDI